MDPEETEIEIPAAEPSLLDSINEALAPTLPVEPVVDDQEDEDDAEGEDEGNEGAEGADEDGERNADGTFKAKPAAKAGDGAGKGDAPKLGADGKPVPAVGPDGKPLQAVKTDPVNDPIPEEVKGRTRERMVSLVNTVKEQAEQIGLQNQLVDSISSTGATSEEFGAMLGYMRWVHSEKPEDLRQAKELLLQELEGVSLRLGEAAPGVDFLVKFPDLQAKVNNGQITTEDAQEIALHRQRTAVNATRQTRTQETEQANQAATTARNGAIGELNELGKTLNSTDAEFAVKHEMLKPVINSLGQLPPARWKAAFLQAYKAITPEEVARWKAYIPTGKKPAGNQPLRVNKVPTGGQQRAPTSLLDAVSAAVDAAG